MKNSVLIISIGFSPNIGGIETHFDDLVRALTKRKYQVYVLTYSPITTPNVDWSWKEKLPLGGLIIRVPWFRGVFYKLVQKPILEFLFLLPGLFFVCPFMLAVYGKNITTIHTHGLVAGFVGIIWGRIFRKHVVTTTHSLYNFSPNSAFTKFAKFIFNRSDYVLTLSLLSKKELAQIGVPEQKISVFTYWVDLDSFKPIKYAKKTLKWDSKFVVLFVGRLVKEKGLLPLLDSVKYWNQNITLAIAGVGPLESTIKSKSAKTKNIVLLGKVTQFQLPLYYSAANILIVPSVHDEGFGRVVLEALACGTPVIGANRGAIPEAINNEVGDLIQITPKSIAKKVDEYYRNAAKLKAKSLQCRNYAMKKYSEKNVETIIASYKF